MFSELSVKDIAQASQVCRHWQVMTEVSMLCEAVRLQIHEDYPANEATKQQAIKHMLWVKVNTFFNPNAALSPVDK